MPLAGAHLTILVPGTYEVNGGLVNAGSEVGWVQTGFGAGCGRVCHRADLPGW